MTLNCGGSIYPVILTNILAFLRASGSDRCDDIRTAPQKLKENEKSARFEARLAALNLEQTQIRADMEMLYVRDDE